MLLLQPTVIVFEDVHWLDEASAELLTHLSLTLEARPWLVVATRRDRPTTFAVPDEANPVQIWLEPLTADASSELIERTLGELPITARQAEELADRAGGNPLFLTELLAAAQRSRRPRGAPRLGRGPDDPRDRSAVAARPAHVAVGGGRRRDVRASTCCAPASASRGTTRPGPVSSHSFVRQEGDALPLPAHAGPRRGVRGPPVPPPTRAARTRRATSSRARAEDSRGRGRSPLPALLPRTPLRRGLAVLAHRRPDARRTIWANVDAAAFYERALAAGRHLEEVTKATSRRVAESLGDVRWRARPVPARRGALPARAVAASRATSWSRRGIVLKQAAILSGSALGPLSQALRWLAPRRAAARAGANARRRRATRRAVRLACVGQELPGALPRDASPGAAARSRRPSAPARARPCACLLPARLGVRGARSRRRRRSTRSARLAIYEELGDLHRLSRGRLQQPRRVRATSKDAGTRRSRSTSGHGRPVRRSATERGLRLPRSTPPRSSSTRAGSMKPDRS